MHIYLGNMKVPWQLIRYSMQHYKAIMSSMFTSIGDSLEKLKYVQGKSYELDRKYTENVYRLAAMVTEHNEKKAGEKVVKWIEDPIQSGLRYYELQALDKLYLSINAQFEGVNQRKIFPYAEKYLPKLGYSKRAHFMNTLVPGLTGGKMLSSEIDSKIDLLGSRRSFSTFIKLYNESSDPPPKKEKKKKDPAKGNEEFVPSKFDMKVGLIVEINRHPDADNLYVAKIDVGERQPRTIVAGLVKYVPIEEMQNRKVIVLANLKPQNMRGVKSSGMVLSAFVENAFEPLIPPAGSTPGDRVFAVGHDGKPDLVLNTKKSDALPKMLEGFKTNAFLHATWNGNDLCTSAGVVIVKSLKDAPIK